MWAADTVVGGVEVFVETSGATVLALPHCCP